MAEENSTETSSPTRDRAPPNLATAQSTAEQNTSARRLSAVYRMKRGLASEVQLEEIDGENAEWYFNSFFGWAATTPISKKILKFNAPDEQMEIDEDSCVLMRLHFIFYLRIASAIPTKNILKVEKTTHAVFLRKIK